MSAGPNSSCLLRLIEQLSDAWWAECMLPRLIEAKAAASLTQTCKQLRVKCQHSATRLSFDSRALYRAVQQDLQHIPQRFPSCKWLDFRLCCRDDAAYGLPHALDAVIGLPSLSGVRLLIEDDKLVCNPWISAPAIGALAPWLPALKPGQDARRFECTIEFTTDWPGNEHVWNAIGRLVRVSHLNVLVGKFAGNYPTILHLASLQPLKQLQSLRLHLGSMVVTTRTQDYSILSNMTKLTELKMPLVYDRQGVTSISSCTNLRCLHFEESPEAVRKLSESECIALGQLVHLSELQLINIAAASSIPAFLSGLQQLEVLQIEHLSNACLPTLARLTQLTELTSTWQLSDAVGALSECTCPSVQHLTVTDHAPWRAFPHVTYLVPLGSWQPAAFLAVSQHCQSISHINLPQKVDLISIAVSAPAQQRVRAIQGLSALQHLTSLSFAPSSDAELAALAELQQVKSLELVVCNRSTCTVSGLVHIAALRGLRELIVELTSSSKWRDANSSTMQLVLAAVRHVCTLKLRLPDFVVPHFKSLVDSATRVLEEEGLQLPDVEVS